MTKGPTYRGWARDDANSRLTVYYGETMVGYISSTGAYVATTTVGGVAQCASATITVTQSASGTFAAAIQLVDGNGDDMAVVSSVGYYLSKNSDGSTIAATSTDVTTLAISGDGLAMEDNADGNVWGRIVSESDGDANLAIVVPASKVVYLVLILPNGNLIISDAMTYGM